MADAQDFVLSSVIEDGELSLGFTRYVPHGLADVPAGTRRLSLLALHCVGSRKSFILFL